MTNSDFFGFNANHNRQVIKTINDSKLIQQANGVLLYKGTKGIYFTYNTSTTFLTYHPSLEKAQSFLIPHTELISKEGKRGSFLDMALEIDFGKPKSE